MKAQQAIDNLMTTHGLPVALAEQCVGDDGNVDQVKLGLVLEGVSWGKAPASSADPRLITALSNAYHEAVTRKDYAAMVSLKTRIFKMGGQILDRKK